MDLRNNQILLGQLLSTPQARGVLEKRFGKWMKHPLFAAAQALTLAQLVEMAKPYLPQKTIEDTLRELRQI